MRDSIYDLRRERIDLSSKIEQFPDEKTRIKEVWKHSYRDHNIDYPDFLEQCKDLKKENDLVLSWMLDSIEQNIRIAKQYQESEVEYCTV